MAHTHYTGTGKIHSFRGLLADGVQEGLRIQGSVGAIAWRISKFEVLGPDAATNMRQVLKIYREEQSSVDTVINFADDELLGAAVLEDYDALATAVASSVIFDNNIFVRNIWLTSKGHTDTPSTNYYIELEEVKVSKAGMAQLAVAAARRTID